VRILHVVPTYWPAVRYGGPIHSLRALCAAQAGLGHEVEVATTSVDGPVDRRELEHESDARVVDGVAVRYFRVPVLRRLYWSPQLRSWLRANVSSFDVLHLHSVFLWPTLEGARTARRRGVPYVVSPKGMLVPDLIDARSPIVKRTWIRLFERRTLAEASAVLVSSRHEAEELPRAVGSVTAAVRVVSHGVDLPEQSAQQRDAGLVLYLGRVSWEKRIDLILRAMAGVPDARLAIVGEGAADYVTELRNLTLELGVADRVDWIGPAHGDEKQRWLARAAFLVLPSVSESFGNVVLEAMAASTPVVVSAGVGARDVVEASDGGVVFEGVDGLQSALTRFLGEPELAVAAGRRGRAYVKAHCTWNAVAEATVSAYASSRVSSV